MTVQNEIVVEAISIETATAEKTWTFTNRTRTIVYSGPDVVRGLVKAGGVWVNQSFITLDDIGRRGGIWFNECWVSNHIIRQAIKGKTPMESCVSTEEPKRETGYKSDMAEYLRMAEMLARGYSGRYRP